MFKSETLSHSTVFEWCVRFYTGRQSTHDGNRVEAPQTALTDQNIRRAEMYIIADRRILVREIAEKLSLSFGSVETVIHEHLKFFKVSLRWAPKQLTEEHSSIELMPVSLLSHGIAKNKMNL